MLGSKIITFGPKSGGDETGGLAAAAFTEKTDNALSTNARINTTLNSL